MSLNHLEIEAVVFELSSKLLPSRLLKVHSQSKTSCQLVLKPINAKRLILFLGLTPRQTRLHLLSTKAPGSSTPPAWIMKLRKELKGMMLVGIDQKKDDRVVMLRFSHKDIRPNRTLLAMLFDKVGQLFLLDEHDLIVFCAIGDQEPGQVPLIPEPKALDTNLASRFPAPNPKTYAANRSVENHYSDLQRKETLREKKREIARVINTERGQLSRRLGRMRKDLEKANQASMLHLQAQALKANLDKAIKGKTELVMNNPYHFDSEPITVQLDPALTPVQNMQRLFKRSSRLQAAQGKIQERIKQDEIRLDKLNRLKTNLLQARSLEEIDDLQREIEDRNLVRRRRAVTGKQPRLPYRIHRSAKELEIFVGRSAKDNHILTFRVARGQDLWLHATGRSGAHVVVRLQPNQQVDEQTLLDAATLAAETAGAKQGDKWEVTYTRVKNVHSIKGAPPGLVSVAEARTILVTIESERIKRLHR